MYYLQISNRINLISQNALKSAYIGYAAENISKDWESPFSLALYCNFVSDFQH